MTNLLIGAVLGLVGSVVANEFLDFSAWIAPRLVHWAARKLPEDHVKRYEEEWNAELDALGGMKLVKLTKALGICAASIRLAHMYKAPNLTAVSTYREFRLWYTTLKKLKSLQLDAHDCFQIYALLIVALAVSPAPVEVRILPRRKRVHLFFQDQNCLDRFTPLMWVFRTYMLLPLGRLLVVVQLSHSMADLRDAWLATRVDWTLLVKQQKQGS